MRRRTRMRGGGIVAVIAVVLAFASAAGVFAAEGGHSTGAGGGTLAAIKASGQLRVAGPVYVPFVVQQPSGAYVGIDVDTLKALATKLGVKLKMEPAGWDTVIAGLITKKWNIVPSLCLLPSRAKVIDFTRTYLDLKTTFYVKASSQLHTLAELNSPNVTFVVATGSDAALLVPKRFPKAKLKKIPGISDPQLAQQVLSGHADATTTDWPVTYSVLRANYDGKFRFIPNDPKKMLNGGCPVAWGIRKGDPQFRNYLNAFLTQFIQSGRYAALRAKYFSPAMIKTLFH
jgi:polar amino acid transport system substrate-binding protein